MSEESYFPVLYRLARKVTLSVAETPEELPQGVSFVILQTNFDAKNLELATEMFDAGRSAARPN